MFLFLFAVVLVVIAALIFVFTNGRNVDAVDPDEALQKEEADCRKKHRRRKSETGIQSPVSEDVLPDKEILPEEDVLPENDWLEVLIAEPAEPRKGRHEAEEMPWKQPREEILPWKPPLSERLRKLPEKIAVKKNSPEKEKKIVYYGTLKPFVPEEEKQKPRDSVSRLILVLEIICGFSAVAALITTVIIWIVQIV